MCTLPFATLPHWHTYVRLLFVLLCGWGAGQVVADDSPATAGTTSTVARIPDQLPVREVTVFKDGHAFVLHEGEMAVDEQDTVLLDQLPNPVIGTFWPYATGDGVSLQSVVAGRRVVPEKETALHVRDLLRANIGSKVRVKLSQGEFAGTIVSIPSRMPPTPPDQPAASEPIKAEVGSVIVLQTAEGFRALPLDSIQEVTFADTPCSEVTTESQENTLALKLQWAEGKRQPKARVGMVYLQKGLRWIPNYRIDLDGQGRAQVTLQATLVNELVDLENVTLNLVVGVPQFKFKDTRDPIGLSQAVAQLSSYFQEGSQTAFAFSNAIQSQVARSSEFRAPVEHAAPGDMSPELQDENQHEDLYIFKAPAVSLKKGERMVLPVVKFQLPYEDIYTLQVPVGPPVEMLRSLNSEQQREMARLMQAPKAIHQARLNNTSKYPLTTAPAILLLKGQLLGQGMMTYASVGGQVDVEVTAAVNVGVTKEDRETGRTPNAAVWADHKFDRIDLEGQIEITNRTGKPIKLEVVRHVLGIVDAAEQEGKVIQVNWRADGSDPDFTFPSWWGWYGWPYGWLHLNGMGKIRWNAELPAGGSAVLPYRWHYFAG